MLQDMPESPPADLPNLSEDAVIAWLKKHADFLQKNPDLCDVLLPPQKVSGKGVVDFQSYMIERLKADKTEAIETAREIVETARHNMNNQTRVHRAVLRLMEACSFEEFIESITSDLTTILDVDITSLVVETAGQKIPHVTASGIKLMPEGTIDQWMMGKRILHQADIRGVEPIYGAGANLVRSQVLVRVDIAQTTPPAVLAFGSRDPQMFQPGQGTEQVTFLGDVVERLFRSWLALTP